MKIKRNSVVNYSSMVVVGFFNTDCPKCQGENAYHDGMGYVCPDCGHEW
ncbi:hypothetical protein K5X82_03170 [Halosquirtibacter xylanolyticus]|nr:hypothetical protein K5X82_03170 [Prolixibacteraceae bacterium]